MTSKEKLYPFIAWEMDVNDPEGEMHMITGQVKEPSPMVTNEQLQEFVDAALDFQKRRDMEELETAVRLKRLREELYGES